MRIEGDIRGRNANRSPLRHGVPRIRREVQDRAVDLARVRQRGPQAGGEVRRNSSMLSNRARQKFRRFLDAIVESQGLRLERALARQRQQPAVHGAALFGGVPRPLQKLSREPIADAILRDLDIARDDVQEIVEIVRDAARQLSDSFEPPRARKRLLVAFALGNVAKDCGKEAPAFAVAPVGHRDIDRDFFRRFCVALLSP